MAKGAIASGPPPAVSPEGTTPRAPRYPPSADSSWPRGISDKSRMSSTGTMTSSSIRFELSGCTIVTGRAPPRNPATSDGGRTVADNPTRCARPLATEGVPRSASSRSSDSARCAPRLVPATAWISSTMTVSTPRNVSRACDVSSRNSDSGVVISMSGGRVASFRLSSAAVSPVRTATWMSGSGRPSRWAACLIPVSGDRRFRSMSTARAFSGEMYSVCRPPSRRMPLPVETSLRSLACFGFSACSCNSTSVGRKPASVLPPPVGAISSDDRPARAFSSSASWWARGVQPRAANQRAKTSGSCACSSVNVAPPPPGPEPRRLSRGGPRLVPPPAIRARPPPSLRAHAVPNARSATCRAR